MRGMAGRLKASHGAMHAAHCSGRPNTSGGAQREVPLCMLPRRMRLPGAGLLQPHARMCLPGAGLLQPGRRPGVLLSNSTPPRVPQSVRQDLYGHLTRLHPDRSWQFVVDQIGGVGVGWGGGGPLPPACLPVRLPSCPLFHASGASHADPAPPRPPLRDVQLHWNGACASVSAAYLETPGALLQRVWGVAAIPCVCGWGCGKPRPPQPRCPSRLADARPGGEHDEQVARVHDEGRPHLAGRPEQRQGRVPGGGGSRLSAQLLTASVPARDWPAAL